MFANRMFGMYNSNGKIRIFSIRGKQEEPPPRPVISQPKTTTVVKTPPKRMTLDELRTLRFQEKL